MKLSIKVNLDTGGEIIVQGENLSAEDANEVFGMLTKHTITNQIMRPESIDDPLPKITDGTRERQLRHLERDPREPFHG